MLDVCLLGTGGMMPLPYRWLTSLVTRCEGSSLLIDCGEGTQIAMKKKGISAKPIDVICFTHYHADHISGLPGLLLTMGNAERKEPVIMIGPKGLERVVGALRTIAPELPFEIIYKELTEKEEEFQIGPYTIRAFKVLHNVLCYGYSVSLKRAGKFQVEKAKEYGLPVNYWGLLQRGNTVEFEGKTYTPDMVMGAERKGIKVTYCTDSRPTQAIIQEAMGSDLFICEGMYGEKDQQQKAREKRHMTMQEAAKLAKEAEPGELWLTHYSPAVMWPDDYLEGLRKIFPRTLTAKDGQSVELVFEEE